MGLLATCGDDIKLWNFDSIKNFGAHPVEIFRPHQGSINCVRWHFNNNVLVSAGDDGSIAVNLSTGALVQRFTSNNNPEYSKRINSICFSSGARYICSGGGDRVVNIWDLKQKEVIQSFKGHTDTITGVRITFDDSHVASSSMSGDVLLHSVRSTQTVATFRAPETQAIRDIQYSPIRKSLLATGGDDGSVHVWNTTARTIHTSFVRQHSAPVTSVCFSPASPLLMVAAGLDKKISFFDISDKKVVKSIHTDAPLSSLLFSDDGLSLFAGSSHGDVFLYDLRAANSPAVTFDAHQPHGVRCMQLQHPKAAGAAPATSSSTPSAEPAPSVTRRSQSPPAQMYGGQTRPVAAVSGSANGSLASTLPTAKAPARASAPANPASMESLPSSKPVHSTPSHAPTSTSDSSKWESPLMQELLAKSRAHQQQAMAAAGRYPPISELQSEVSKSELGRHRPPLTQQSSSAVEGTPPSQGSRPEASFSVLSPLATVRSSVLQDSHVPSSRPAPRELPDSVLSPLGPVPASRPATQPSLSSSGPSSLLSTRQPATSAAPSPFSSFLAGSQAAPSSKPSSDHAPSSATTSPLLPSVSDVLPPSRAQSRSPLPPSAEHREAHQPPSSARSTFSTLPVPVTDSSSPEQPSAAALLAAMGMGADSHSPLVDFRSLVPAPTDAAASARTAARDSPQSQQRVPVPSMSATLASTTLSGAPPVAAPFVPPSSAAQFGPAAAVGAGPGAAAAAVGPGPGVTGPAASGGPALAGPGPGPGDFGTQVLQRLIDDSLLSFRSALHADMQNMHLEILRQFHLQQTELSALLENHAARNTALLEEVNALRAENRRLRNMF